MRYSISDTAEYGDYTPGKCIISDQTRKVLQVLRQTLKEIQDDTYASEWISETNTGRAWFSAIQSQETQHPIEKIGADLRRMLPFLKPVRSRAIC